MRGKERWSILASPALGTSRFARETLTACSTSTRTNLAARELFRLNQDDGSLMLVYVRVTDTQYLEFFPNGQGDGPAPRTAVGLNHICLAVSDLDRTVAELTARGVEITQAIKYGRDGNRQAWIADPEGNRIELMEMAADSKQAEAIARLGNRQ